MPPIAPRATCAMAEPVITARQATSEAYAPRMGLTPGGLAGQFELDALVLIRLLRGLDIQVRDRNLLAMPGRQVEQVRADNRVVFDFQLVPIFEHEDG